MLVVITAMRTNNASSQILLGCGIIECCLYGGSKVLWNGGNLPQHYTASQPRRSQLESSLPWKPQVLQLALLLAFKTNKHFFLLQLVHHSANHSHLLRSSPMLSLTKVSLVTIRAPFCLLPCNSSPHTLSNHLQCPNHPLLPWWSLHQATIPLGHYQVQTWRSPNRASNHHILTSIHHHIIIIIIIIISNSHQHCVHCNNIWHQVFMRWQH